MQAGLNTVLEQVSRSFYLTIRMLPPSLRSPVGLAYLLARTSDTVADSASATVQVRAEMLKKMGEAVRGRGPMPDMASLASGVGDPAERTLLGQAGTLLELLNRTESADRADIVRVLEEILWGQGLDVTRFPGNGETIQSLTTAAELENYTYSVAGCVGEFWTRICSRHLPDYAPRIHPEHLVKLGVAFGKGLQLINILRDAPADFANGRCYFPAEEMQGTDLEALRTNPALARPVYDHWMARARELLDDGLRYIGALRPWRLRLACFLPWALGMRTLRQMERTHPLEVAHRVKVPRKEVHRLLILGMVGALGNAALLRVARHVKK